MKKPIMKMKARMKIAKDVYDKFTKEYGRAPNWPAETYGLSQKASKIARKRQGLSAV
jgi:hypothetical protein